MELVGGIAIGFLGVVGSWLQFRRHPVDPRDSLKKELELLAMMPDGDQMREKWRDYIAASVDVFVKDDSYTKTRSIEGVVLALVLLIVGGIAIAVAVMRDGWWWFLMGPGFFFAALGLFGFARDYPKRQRDSRGRPIED